MPDVPGVRLVEVRLTTDAGTGTEERPDWPFPPHERALFLVHDENRGSYVPLADWLGNGRGGAEGLTEDGMRSCIEADSLWTMSWRPPGAAGSEWAAAHSLAALLGEAGAAALPFPEHSAGLELTHDVHASMDRSIGEMLRDDPERWSSMAPDDAEECLRLGHVWTLQWYPTTPIGSVWRASATLRGLMGTLDARRK